MQKSGNVAFSNGEPSLDDGTRLAICGDPSPFVAAGTFLKNQGIRDGDMIRVTGEPGTIGGVSVFCMTAAVRVDAATMELASPKRAAVKKAVVKKAAPKATRKSLKKVSKPKSKNEAKGAPSKSKASKLRKRP